MECNYFNSPAQYSNASFKKTASHSILRCSPTCSVSSTNFTVTNYMPAPPIPLSSTITVVPCLPVSPLYSRSGRPGLFTFISPASFLFSFTQFPLTFMQLPLSISLLSLPIPWITLSTFPWVTTAQWFDVVVSLPTSEIQIHTIIPIQSYIYISGNRIGKKNYIKWVSYHYGLVQHPTSDGEESLQMPHFTHMLKHPLYGIIKTSLT